MAIKPLEFYGRFQPRAVDTSQAESMRALAGLGDTARKISTQYGIKQSQLKGAVEGEQAGREAAQKGEDVELRSFGYGSSQYNAALVKAYGYEAYSQIDNHIADAQMAHPNSTIDYQSVLDSKMQGMLNAVPEELRGDIESYYSRANKSAFNSVQKEEIKITNARAKASFESGLDSLENTIGNSARAGNADDVQEMRMQHSIDIATAEQANIITPAEAQSRLDTINDEIAIQTQEGQVDSVIFSDLPLAEQAKQGRELVEQLRKTPLSELSPTQNDTLLNRLDSKVKEREKQLISENKISATKLRTEQGIGNVDALIGNTAPVSVDVITQKDANNHYDERVLVGLPDDPIVRSNLQAEYVNAVRFVPSSIKQELVNGLRSGDDAQIAVSADTILKIGAVAGMPETFTKQELAFADAVNRQLEYFSPDEAVANARRIVYPENQVLEAMVQAKTAELKDAKEKKKNQKSYVKDMEDMFNDKFFGGFVPNDIGKDALLQDYQAISEDLYLGGFATLEGARDQAKKVIASQWTTSEFGFMQHAPEQYYGLGDEKDVLWIRDSLADRLEGQFGDRTFKKENIFLVSDTETARTVTTGKPTYSAMVRMDDGTLESVYFVDDAGNVQSRVNPALVMEGARKKRQEEILKQAQADMPTTYKGSFNAKEFMKGTYMDSDQQARMRKALESSTNPFALLGKAIGNLDEVPSIIGNYFGRQEGVASVALTPNPEDALQIIEDIRSWNEGYLERLNVASINAKAN